MSDFINRQAVIKALDSINCFGWVEDSWKNVCSIIEHVPAAQPERKKGRWIVDEDGNIECSVCGHHGVGDLYCERCGAKMDEKERGWKK